MISSSHSDSTVQQSSPPIDLAAVYRNVRGYSVALTEPLTTEDMVIQSMPDASPAKWHLAHTTWFFEHFILSRRPGFKPFCAGWDYLFNSYYYSVGDMHLRPERGLLSRPGVAEIMQYRAHVDAQIEALLSAEYTEELAMLMALGLNHEQQHQELILTDIKHVLSLNPLQPAYIENHTLVPAKAVELNFGEHPGGIREIGATGDGFCFDNETPRHRVLLNPYAIANRPVSNAEYLAFVQDGGYQRTDLWLSEAWATVTKEQWQRPVYWSQSCDSEFSMYGQIALDPNRPVSHISYYEADAFARWAGHQWPDVRLPTEAEWEVAAETQADADQSDVSELHPRVSGTGSNMFGNVWNWTQSAYSAYPGFKPLGGSLGEYNGKFMCSQLVLKGSSCFTPAGHSRSSYRNFFYPASRWQATGIRLTRSLAT